MAVHAARAGGKNGSGSPPVVFRRAIFSPARSGHRRSSPSSGSESRSGRDRAFSPSGISRRWCEAAILRRPPWNCAPASIRSAGWRRPAVAPSPGANSRRTLQRSSASLRETDFAGRSRSPMGGSSTMREARRRRSWRSRSQATFRLNAGSTPPSLGEQPSRCSVDRVSRSVVRPARWWRYCPSSSCNTVSITSYLPE